MTTLSTSTPTKSQTMEVQIRMPSPPASDFNFHIGDWRCCVSAPTSPSRASGLYREFNQTDDDFAFHVSKEAAKCTVSAAELFDNGRIRALNPPPNRPYGSRDGGEGGIELTRSRKSPLLKGPFLLPPLPFWFGLKTLS